MEQNSFKVSLPYPLSLNQTYCPAGNTIRLTKKARAYKKLVRQHLQVLTVGRKPLEFECLDIFIKLFPKREQDMDNSFKLLFDAMQGFIYLNDKQIKRQTSEIMEVSDNPRVEIFCREYFSGALMW